MKEISRKTMLYKTGVEYGDYTMNHVLGCSHGCKYPCYAYLLKKRFKQVVSYEEWLQPAIVSNTLDLLKNEIPRLKGKIKSVQLCFMTDPFMLGHDLICELSLSSIKMLNASDIKCTVLTKGILPIELADFSPDNEYGITLVSLDEGFRKDFEPGAAQIESRIKALEELHNRGCKTWVSIEPYPTPNIINQDLQNILNRVSFVDKIIFGKMNYNKNISEYLDWKQFYNNCSDTVKTFCENNKISYHIKEGTNSKDIV